MINMELIFILYKLIELGMFYNPSLKHYSVQSRIHTPSWAQNISVAPLIQDHKNIFMRASGHWATAMFAIFFALHDSIQASRLILRAPTVSPSIRNMYNSTACFFFLSFFFLHKHTLILLPAFSDEVTQGKKRIVCLGKRKEVWWRSCWWHGAAFYFPQWPQCSKHKSHVVLHAGTLTDCHMAAHC